MTDATWPTAILTILAVEIQPTSRTREKPRHKFAGTDKVSRSYFYTRVRPVNMSVVWIMCVK